MSASQQTKPMLWQHPFVNIFKQFRVEDWKKSSKEGDVTSVMDKQLKCTVFKIQGSVPAGNYIQFPRTSTQSLGLTGRYFYILFKPIPTKYFVVHIDTVSEDGLVVRISFSNLFKEFKSTSTWLQFPFACQAAKGSVEHYTSVGAKNDFMGPAPLSQRWTMLVMDLHYILSMYINRKYSHMKNVRLCANLLVKNCFTSDISYDPRLSVRQARMLGIKSVDETFAPIPREMSYFLPKTKEWDDLYDIVRFPLSKETTSSPSHVPLLPFDSIQRNVDENTSPIFSSRIKSKPGIITSPKRGKTRTVDTTKKSGLFSTASNNIAVATTVPSKPRKPKMRVTRELPTVGVSLNSSIASCSDATASVVEASSGDIHVFASSKPEQEVIVHRHFTGKKKSSVASTNLNTHKTTISNLDRRSESRQQSMLIGDKLDLETSGEMICLQPDPIIKLKRIIGFGSGLLPYTENKAYRHLALWHPTTSLNGGNDVVVYAVHAVVVAIETANGHQHFFVGHTEKVTSLAFNNHQGSPCILASAQSGAGGIVRIWKFESQKCAAIIRSQHSTGMNILAFSKTGGVLVGIGKDGHGKTLFMVWNTSAALRHGSVSVIAKAHTDVEISRVRVSPIDDTRMVTCGRDNIRFWRVRSNQLRSCPVAMPTEHKVEEITDVTFAPFGIISSKNYNESLESGSLSVYACTKAGYVLEVDFQKVAVMSVHRLYPSNSADNNAEEVINKGIALNTLKFTSTFVASGSDDGVLRLWPLDLSSVFLEAEHEGPVTDIDLTPDGTKVLAATSVATLGFLDISTRKYSTIMRSHTDIIGDGCMDGLRRTICTCSDDRSIRVWDIDTLRQLYDFATPEDTPTAISCHPMLEIFACGFESGAVRVFHVGNTSVLSEHTNVHPGSQVTSIVFTPSADRLITRCEKGTVAVFDTSDVENVGAPLLRSLPNVAAHGNHYGPQALSVSQDGRRVAFIGPNEFTVTVSNASTLDELLRTDVSAATKADPDILGQRPKVDVPLRITFSPSSIDQLVVVTMGNRLLKLDGKSGRLLSVTDNVHRGSTTSLCIGDDCCHLVTAGDKLIKVWDYKMSKDISCQAFIGHSSSVNRVLFTPDRLTLITCGEDAIFLWDFLGCGTPRHPMEEDHQVETLGRTIKTDLLLSARKHDEEEAEETPRASPPAPMIPQAYVEDESAWVPPEILRTSDLDASEVSEFTVDAQMMQNLQGTKLPEEGNSTVAKQQDVCQEDTLKQLSETNLKTLEKQTKSLAASINDSMPVRVAWVTKPPGSPDFPTTHTRCSNLPSARLPEPETMVVTFQKRPNVISHFGSLMNDSQAATRYFAPPEGEEGLKLQSVIGYNGNARHNLAWNPDTGRLAYSSGCLIVLENLTSGEREILKGHTEEISCLAMQHDGLILASASGSKGMISSRICLWDVKSNACKATLKHHEHDIVSLAYSRDDRFLVSMGDYRENSLVVWSGFNGLSAPVVLASTKTLSAVHQVVWDPYTSNEFVTVGHDASILFWMLDEHKKDVTLNVHEADIPENLRIDETRDKPVHFTAACYGEERMLYIGSSSGFVSVWDTSANRCFLHWKADSAEICLMQSRACRLLVAGASRAARLWSLAGVKEMRYSDSDGKPGNLYLEDELTVHAEVISGSFDDALDMGIVGTTSGTLWYLDWNERSTVRMVSGHSEKINGLAFDEGNYFATCSEEGTVRLWSVRSMELAVQFQVINQSCGCISFSHFVTESCDDDVRMRAHKMLAAGYSDGTLRVFDIDKLILKLRLQPHTHSVTAVEFSAENDTLLSGASDGTVAVTSLATGVTLRVLRDHKGSPINSITVSLRKDHPVALTELDSARSGSSDCQLCLVCGGDRRVSVWKTEWKHDVCEMIDWLTFPAPCFAPDGSKLTQNDKKSMQILPPSSCCFHPTEADLLMYCGYGMSKCIQMYSLTQKKVVKSLPLPNWATCMAVSPVGALVATGTSSRLLELIDAEHGTFQDFTGHCGQLSKAKFSPAGELLLTSSGCELLVWKVCVNEPENED